MLPTKNNTLLQLFYEASRHMHAPPRPTGIAHRHKQKAEKMLRNAGKVYLCGTLDELSLG